MTVISLDIMLNSTLISNEGTCELVVKFAKRPWLTAQEIISLDLPVGNRVEALLRLEFLSDAKLREIACDFVEHTLYIYEHSAPRDCRPRQCIKVARLFVSGSAKLKDLQETIKETIPVVWRFEKTEFTCAFNAGLAATFLDHKSAADMAQIIAKRTQMAAHYYACKVRKSSTEPVIARELEAIWQLKRIVEVLYEG